MRQYFLKKEGSESLLLFFGGWGSGPELFSDCVTMPGHDCMLCYDYRTPDFDCSLLDNYRNIYLLAWSMGVWVADCILSGDGMESARGRLVRCVAVGGTLAPIDDTMGIPVPVFKGTLEGMSAPVLAKFRRRMCGKDLGYFMEHLPDRGPDELKDELASLYAQVTENPGKYGTRYASAEESPMTLPAEKGHIHWNLAVVGGNDLIFPASNQLAAWKDNADRVLQTDSAHYDRALFERLLKGI